MKKVYTKLLLTLTALIVSGVLVVSVSYAWLVMSNNPVAEGIQVTIGGGNTILVAADQVHEAGGEVHHYPGAFSDTLNFSQSGGYTYLSQVSELTPVSTADGINWFIPVYYDLTDPEVQEGKVLSGTLKSWNEFVPDNALMYANLRGESAEKASQGSYVYLDFWVVSPGSDYTLRISTGDDSGGSYVIGLPEAVERESGGYGLSSGGSDAEACVRVGLLANSDFVTDDTMWYYQSSPAYSPSYTRLRGNYQEPGESPIDSFGYRFTIFEPNADLHPTMDGMEGNYLVTRPLGRVGNSVFPVDVGAFLTVQTGNSWADAPEGEGTQLEQRFRTAALEPSFRGLSPDEMVRKFYDEYLQGQVGPYVRKGVFVKNTGSLYNAVDSDGVADAAFLGEGYTANATDDVFIVTLEKNVPQRIRMFVWLEGQDADCVNSAEASSFAFRIELAGSNEEIISQTGAVQVTVPDDESDVQAEEPENGAGEVSGAGDEPQSDTLNETEVDEEQNE